MRDIYDGCALDALIFEQFILDNKHLVLCGIILTEIPGSTNLWQGGTPLLERRDVVGPLLRIGGRRDYAGYRRTRHDRLQMKLRPGQPSVCSTARRLLFAVSTPSEIWCIFYSRF